jgi:hypothetical protein
MRVNETVRIRRTGKISFEGAVIRDGATVDTFTGSHRYVMERILKYTDPETLDGIRKVRTAPLKAKIY